MRSNRHCSAAVRLGTLCGISLNGMPAFGQALCACLHLIGIVPNHSPAPEASCANGSWLKIDWITRRGSEHAVLHQAHHLRLLVKGDSLFCSEGANDDGRRGPAMEPTGRGWTRSRAKAAS